MDSIGEQIEQCRLCCTKGIEQIDLQRETEFSQYVFETIGQHIKEVRSLLFWVNFVQFQNE